jgi:CRISPR/Cas system endoribonuclease Cas6 (RAMP superfamily)
MIKNALHRLNNEDVAELLHERENKSPFSFPIMKAYKKNEHTCVQPMNDVSTNVCSMWGLIPYGEVEVAS